MTLWILLAFTVKATNKNDEDDRDETHETEVSPSLSKLPPSQSQSTSPPMPILYAPTAITNGELKIPRKIFRFIPRRIPKIPRLLPRLPPIPIPQIWKIPQIAEFLKRHKTKISCGAWQTWPCTEITHHPALIGGCIAMIITMCIKGHIDTVSDCALTCAKSINTVPYYGKVQHAPSSLILISFVFF